MTQKTSKPTNILNRCVFRHFLQYFTIYKVYVRPKSHVFISLYQTKIPIGMKNDLLISIGIPIGDPSKLPAGIHS